VTSDPSPGGRTRSEEQWLRINDYLRGNRYSLAVAAAGEYPDAVRLAGTPLLAAPAWRLPAPIPLASVRLDFRPQTPPPALPDLASVAPYALPTRADGRRYQRYCDVIESLAAPTVFENRAIYRLVSADRPAPSLGWGSRGAGSSRASTSAARPRSSPPRRRSASPTVVRTGRPSATRPT
jgi:hypothetical protein